MNPTGLQLTDFCKIVTGCAPAALTGAAGDGDYVSMKNFRRLTVVLTILNATTVTTTAVTMKQASAVAGTGEKALSFSKVYRNLDCAASDTLTEAAVVSDTFNTDTTNSKQLKYVIEIDASMLDIDNGFDCVRFDGTGMVNAVGNVEYILHGARNNPPLALAAITD